MGLSCSILDHFLIAPISLFKIILTKQVSTQKYVLLFRRDDITPHYLKIFVLTSVQIHQHLFSCLINFVDLYNHLSKNYRKYKHIHDGRRLTLRRFTCQKCSLVIPSHSLLHLGIFCSSIPECWKPLNKSHRGSYTIVRTPMSVQRNRHQK